jgi:hypothetical protein
MALTWDVEVMNCGGGVEGDKNDELTMRQVRASTQQSIIAMQAILQQQRLTTTSDNNVVLGRGMR